MKISAIRLLSLLSLVLIVLAVGFSVGRSHPASKLATAGVSFEHEMDEYCKGKLSLDYFAKLSPDERKGITDETFYSSKLHTCVEVDVTLDPKNPGSMNYVLSDLTYGFLAPRKWHPYDMPLHVIQTDYGTDHHLSAEGYWAPVSSDPGQKPVADANSVNLSCDYSDRRGEEPNMCTETEGYTQFGTIKTDTQTYHIASWSNDEVIATNSQKGLSGTTTTTLLIHPDANEIEIVDRTRMNKNQPELTKGMEDKTFGDHYELHGGMYQFITSGVFFQCDEDRVVTDMRLDVTAKHHGDIFDVPNNEWNAGSRSNKKFTSQQCDEAMKKKLMEFH